MSVKAKSCLQIKKSDFWQLYVTEWEEWQTEAKRAALQSR